MLYYKNKAAKIYCLFDMRKNIEKQNLVKLYTWNMQAHYVNVRAFHNAEI
jgi:hypothetical protein